MTTYREFQPREELSDLVACTWERTVAAGGDQPEARILPDGCVDLIWLDGRLIVAGPDRAPFISTLRPGETVVGLRLRPGAAGVALGLPARELRGIRPELDDVWGSTGRELGERIGGADAAAGRRDALERALLERRRDAEAPDRLVLAAIRALGRPGSRVAALGREIGLSERQLRRRFDEAVGYGPKTLDRVLRFQRFVARVTSPNGAAEPLAGLAAELGYADQAHLGRDCRALSGLTPARLAADL